MKWTFAITVFLIVAAIGGAISFAVFSQAPSQSEAEDGFVVDVPQSAGDHWYVHPRLRGLQDWQRSAGPIRVGLQIGHLDVDQVPAELDGIRTHTGTSGGGTTEVAVNRTIAEMTKTLLEQRGMIVDLLPATIPPNYWADVFVAIHADGNLNTRVSGYKVAAPRRDYSGQSAAFASLLEQSYGAATKIDLDPNVSRTMRGYYAFNWRRYEHSIHPMTVAAILETGFLTNASDRRVIVQAPEKSAAGIAGAIVEFTAAIKG